MEGIFWQTDLRRMGESGVKLADKLNALGMACDDAAKTPPPMVPDTPLTLREDSKLFADAAGIYVRARDKHGGWSNYDIAQLDKPSLLRWLKSKGEGENAARFARNVVATIFHHGSFE